MTFCKRCGITLRDNSAYCVLCGTRTQPRSNVMEQEYPTIKYSNRFRYIVRVLAMISVAAVLVSLYLDYTFDSDTIWSLIVLGATIYGWTAFLSRKSYKNVGLMIFIQLIAISVLGYLIDISTGNHGWMLDYVVPFMLVAAQGIMTALMIARPLLFRDFVLYELQIGVMGILSVLLMLFGIAKVHWPYVMVCIYSAVLLIGTALLADRKMKQELVKRFHF